MMAAAVLVQVDARALEALERIAVAQVVMAAIMALIGLIALGGVVLVMVELRMARRQVRGLLDEMKPRLVPLIDRAREMTDDMSGVSESVRRKVDDLLYTAETLNRSVQRGSAAAEERLRRFAAVLDIVQTETEDLLLDAAATAHGVQETARVLRQSGARRGPSAADAAVHTDELQREEGAHDRAE